MTKEEVLKEIDKIDFARGDVREIVIKSGERTTWRTVFKIEEEERHTLFLNDKID